jgi:hypothetical protein
MPRTIPLTQNVRTVQTFEKSTNKLSIYKVTLTVVYFFVTIAQDSVPTPSRSAAVLSKSHRHTARFFSTIASSPSSSGLPTVGCRLSAIPRKPLILNPFQASRLSSFLPTLAHPSAKSFPCVSYGNIGGWGSGPTNSSQAHRPYSSISWASLPSSTSHQSPITSHAFFSSQFVGCASTPPCGTLVLLYLLQPNPSRG